MYHYVSGNEAVRSDEEVRICEVMVQQIFDVQRAFRH